MSLGGSSSSSADEGVVAVRDAFSTSSVLRSPKMPPRSGRPSSPGSQYYAGYSAPFVEDVINGMGLPDGSSVLDPWNGAGTTTWVAAGLGLDAVGIDINPALVVVGKARLLGREVFESLDTLAKDITEHAKSLDSGNGGVEPLELWFAPATARHLRQLDRSIQHVLVSSIEVIDLTMHAGLMGLSSLAAHFYVALFETVRSFLGAFATSNPTWIKSHSDGRRISVPAEVVQRRFREAQQRLRRRACEGEVRDPPICPTGRADVRLGSSHATALQDASVDAIISSPPYCTRIDYAMLTRPELAVLGVGDGVQFRQLRESMIGTPTMVNKHPATEPALGASAAQFIMRVSNHNSKASGGYYRKYFLQYFSGMYASLMELKRVVKPGGLCTLVLQDSYYKEIHNDLALHLVEMAIGLGWAPSSRVDFAVNRTFAAVNPGSRTYRATFKTVESVVVLIA